MKLLTFAVTSCVYAMLGIAAAALLWRAGGGWGAGAAAAVGTFALFFALHALVTGRFAIGSIRRDVGRIRDANLIFAEELEKTQDDLAKLSTLVHEEKATRGQALSSEVRMLEDLVRRMSDTMQARLGKHRPANEEPAALPAARLSPQEILLQTVRDALAENRVDLYLQPVMSLPQRRTVFYESFSRLRDASGRVMMPAEYLPAAEPEGLVSAIDNLLLFRCVQIVRKLAKQDRKVAIFCNISLRSLSDETFFPQFLEFLSENRDLAGALIFELGQAAFLARGATEARNMAKLADLGYRFSLDKVTDLQLDLIDLSRADVKFVKVAATVLAEQLAEVNGRLTLKAFRDLEAADFATMARRYGVEIIAEKIEEEREVIGVLELDVRYGQGHLFGEPRAIRDQVLAETAPPADFIRRTLRRTAA
ncbi:MAG TPA: EAL domain-containing protein [Caulobacteraceae bacterium]|jgi:cyclic-di-GMP phosphodiesterase TipF (flagellum assembly factor)